MWIFCEHEKSKKGELKGLWNCKMIKFTFPLRGSIRYIVRNLTMTVCKWGSTERLINLCSGYWEIGTRLRKERWLNIVSSYLGYYVRCVFGRAVIRTYEIPLHNARELSLFHGETMQKFKKKKYPDSSLPCKNSIE